MAKGQQKQDHLPVKGRIKYFNERNGRMQPLDNSSRAAIVADQRRDLRDGERSSRERLRGDGFPPEQFADARSDLRGAITGRDFHVPHTRLAQSFLLDGISGCCGTLIMPVSLIFDCQDRRGIPIDD